MKCVDCGGETEVLKDKLKEGIPYEYYRCKKCGEEVLDMKQLKAVAEKFREMKKYNVKLTKWGNSLGLRIPQSLTKKYNFKDKKEVMIIPEEKGIKIIPV